MKIIKKDYVYEDWGLYECAFAMSNLQYLKHSYAISELIAKHFLNNNKISILELFSGPYSYYKNNIKYLLSQFNKANNTISISNYHCVDALYIDGVTEKDVIISDVLNLNLKRIYDVIIIPYSGLSFISDDNIQKFLTILKMYLNKDGIIININSGGYNFAFDELGEDEFSVAVNKNSLFYKQYKLKSPGVLDFIIKGEYDRINNKKILEYKHIKFSNKETIFEYKIKYPLEFTIYDESFLSWLYRANNLKVSNYQFIQDNGLYGESLVKLPNIVDSYNENYMYPEISVLTKEKYNE